MVPILLFLGVFCFTIAAIAAGNVSGVVHDPTGAIVTNARVRLDAIAGAANQSLVTGPDGRFEFRNFASDRAVLSIEAPGFERVVREVAPGTLSCDDMNIVLSLRALPQQVSVTATGYLEDLDDSARATAVVDRAELDRRLEFSVAESLREVAGVRITQVGGPGSTTNIRIRGLRAQDTAVLIDGMRFRDPAATQADASAFTADLLTLNISRLEVLRGCGSALYGSSAMGGVVNIVSDAGGGRVRGDWMSEGGQLGFFRSQARVAGGADQDRLTYSLGVGHVNVTEGLDGDDRARNSSAQAYLQYRARERVLLSARIFANNSFVGLNRSPALTSLARVNPVIAIPLPDQEVAKWQQGLPYDLGNATVFPSGNDPDSRRASWLTSALLALDQQLTSRLNYRIAYQLVDTRRSFPNGPGGIGFQPLLGEDSTFNGRVDTAQARLNWATQTHLISGGVEWEREALDNGGITQMQPPSPPSSFRAQISQRSFAIVAEDRWRMLGSRLQFTLSGRAQRFDLSEPHVSGSLPAYLTGASPRAPNSFTGDASVMYHIGRTNTKLRAHFGNAFRAPSLFERYGTAYSGGAFIPYGDPRLSPERSFGGDAGLDQYFGQRRIRFSATYFYTQLDSVIAFDFSGLINRTTDPFGRSSGYFSTQGALARGIEIEGQVALWKGFHLSGAYTHTKTLERRQVAAGTLRTPRIFEHTVSFAASQTWRRLTLTGNFLGAPEYIGVISSRAVIWPGPRRLDATAAYHLSIAERFSPQLFGRVENVLNQHYYEDGFRTPLRWVVAGIRMSF